MKNIKILTLFILAIIGFNSCTDDDNLTYIAQPIGEFAFTNTTLEEYVLTPGTSGNLGERFTWNSADFGVETNINYELQKSIVGDFSDMEVVGSTSGNSIDLTIGDLLGFANEAGLDNDPETPEPDTGSVNFRLRASVGTDSSTEIFSPNKTLTLFLPESGGEEEPPLVNLFLVGNATASGWNNPGDNPPIIRHPDNVNQYSYRAYFDGIGTEFKLIEIVGQWQPQWGAEDATTAAVNDGTGSDPSAFSIPASGYYDFAINTSDMSYTLVPYDASGDTSYTTIGIIGDSTPGLWDSDTNMTQSTFDPHIWYIYAVDLVDGEMKMRADDDWAVNWGSNTAISGFGGQDGPNIPVTAGTYDIWFNDLDGGYIFIPVE